MLIGGLEFKRLLRASGIDLTPAENSYLRKKCGDASGEVGRKHILVSKGLFRSRPHSHTHARAFWVAPSYVMLFRPLTEQHTQDQIRSL